MTTKFKQYSDVINGGSGLVRCESISLSVGELEALRRAIGASDYFAPSSRSNLLAQIERALVLIRD